MKDPTVISQLADPTAPAGQIRFIHSDGQEHLFATCVNSLTGSRLAWFDSSAPMVDCTTSEIKAFFKNIRAKAKQIIEVIGDY